MSASTSSASGKPDRLYVGNLSPTVDEYTLVQVFSKYGKITKLDVMYHKSGPQRGKPRGYAFIEYASKDDALKALVKLHDRLLRGRKLVVTYANAAPPDEGMYSKSRRAEPEKTTLSMLKQRGRPLSAQAQIAAMESKLAQMAKRPGRAPTPERVEAEGLEAEIQRELAEAGVGEEAQRSKSNSPDTRRPSDEQEAKAETSGDLAAQKVDARSEAVDAVERISDSKHKRSPAPLDAPPTQPAPSPAPTPEPASATTARQAAFRRGLASLPKKPVFSPY